MNGIFLKHKGIIDLDTDISITNTILFFQKIINSFGLKNQIKIKITPEKEVLFIGAIVDGPRPNPEKPGEYIYIRHEDFIKEIEKTRLAHIVVKYFQK